VLLLAATVALGILLSVAFDVEVQTVDADELVARSDDARAFLIADLFFIGLYAVLLPLAIWRFGAAITGGSPPLWVKAAALLLVGAGLADLTENVLLLTATGSISEGAVDAAHAAAVPKTVLFVAGAALALAVSVRAIRVLRA
jgi:uncharacterized membrane protein